LQKRQGTEKSRKVIELLSLDWWIKVYSKLVNIVRTVARKSSNRLKFCWLKVICCICQSNEFEHEIKQKTGGKAGGQTKMWGGMANPGPP